MPPQTYLPLASNGKRFSSQWHACYLSLLYKTGTKYAGGCFCTIRSHTFVLKTYTVLHVNYISMEVEKISKSK